MKSATVAHLETVPAATGLPVSDTEPQFAVVKILDGMAGSSFLFDNDADARAFFLAASNVHNMGKGRSKCALFLKGHAVMDGWRF